MTREDSAIATEKACREAIPIIRKGKSERAKSITNENEHLKQISLKYKVSIEKIKRLAG